MKKRYSITINCYVWGDEEQAKEQAEKIAKEINDKHDNNAVVVGVVKHEFGEFNNE